MRRPLGLLFLFLLSCSGLAAQMPDSLPQIVAGQMDWAKFKRKMGAPSFQQNDLAIYVLRKNDLTSMIAEEGSNTWVNDWHFVDLNRDRHVDAVYSGATKARGGYYTYFMLADTGLSYPKKFEAPGYVHLIQPDSAGLDFWIREDAHGKGYLHRISRHRYQFRQDSSFCKWELQMLSTTEIPELRQPEMLVLQQATPFRSSPRLINEPSMDYNQDGKPDATGNVIGQVAAGMHCIRLAETTFQDLKWSFVILREAPKGIPLFAPKDGIKTFFVGWLQSAAFN